MPLFVPFGHWFVFDSGKIIAKYLAYKRALISLLPFIPFVFYGVYTGGDTRNDFIDFGFSVYKWGP